MRISLPVLFFNNKNSVLPMKFVIEVPRRLSHYYPVLGIWVLLPRSWIILDKLEFLAKILDFFISCQYLGFLAKILAVNLAKKSKNNEVLGKKSKILPVEIREENHNCFYKYKVGYKHFSS